MKQLNYKEYPMSIDSQAKLEADIKLVETETEKIRAEIVKIEKECEGKKSKIGNVLIEGIKVFGAVVIGLGGVIASYNGYQLSEIKKERSEFAIEKNKKEADDAKAEAAKAQSELEKLEAIRSATKENIDALQNSQKLLTIDINKLREKFYEAKAQLPTSTSTAALENAINNTEQSTQQLQLKVRAVNVQDIKEENAARESTSIHKEKLYYVIAMTSSDKKDIEKEIDRVKMKVGDAEFDRRFPDIEIYAPKDDLLTLLISGKSLPRHQADELKDRARASGFKKDTWLWQSNNEYFSQKK